MAKPQTHTLQRLTGCWCLAPDNRAWHLSCPAGLPLCQSVHIDGTAREPPKRHIPKTPRPLHIVAIAPGTGSSPRSSLIGQPPGWTAIVALRPSQTTSSEGDSPAPTWTTPAGTRSRRAGIQHRCLICVLKEAQKIRDSQARTGTTHTCNLHNRSCFSTRVRARPCPRREGIQIQARYLPNRINIGIPSSETFFSLSQPPARLFLQSDLS
jgi:hypothetical protein